MDTYEQYELRLTAHAHQRYVERVEQKERDELSRWCTESIQRHNYCKRGKLLQIDDVWFGIRKNRKRKLLTLTTCFGRSHLDLPEAIIWAERHNDRINLKESFIGEGWA